MAKMYENWKPLYHYCSLDTFIKIVQNKTLRLSDVTKSNDALEMAWYQQQCTELIQEKWKKYINKRSDVTTTNISAFNEIIALSQGLAKDNPLYVWTLCLSQRRDDLSQWRGYADDARGISIGFDMEKLRSFSYFSGHRNDIKFIGLIEIVYNKKELVGSLNSLLDQTISAKTKPSEAILYLRNLINNAPTIAMRYKHSSFKAEAEWRVVVYGFKKDPLPAKALIINNDLALREIGFFERNDYIVSYLDISIKEISSYIREIIIGPKSKATIQDIESMLIVNRILRPEDLGEIPILKSESSYR